MSHVVGMTTWRTLWLRVISCLNCFNKCPNVHVIVCLYLVDAVKVGLKKNVPVK